MLFSSLNSLLLVSYIVLVYNINIRRLYKWLIVLVLYILTSVLLQVVKPNFSDVELSNWATSVITKLAALTLYSAVFLLVKDNLIRVFSLIIISAGLSNLINHFYYPYQVIDFINVEGSYQLLKIGVFNIADVAFDIGFIGLIISVLVYICKSKKKHHSYHSKLFN